MFNCDNSLETTHIDVGAGAGAGAGVAAAEVATGLAMGHCPFCGAKVFPPRHPLEPASPGASWLSNGLVEAPAN